MQAEEALQRIDKLPVHMRWLARSALVAVTGFVFYMWCGFAARRSRWCLDFLSAAHLHQLHELPTLGFVHMPGAYAATDN